MGFHSRRRRRRRRVFPVLPLSIRVSATSTENRSLFGEEQTLAHAFYSVFLLFFGRRSADSFFLHFDLGVSKIMSV